MRSSLGFHTMSLTTPLFKPETPQLISDFQRYGSLTHNIQIYTKDYITYINFLSRRMGISWLIRYDVWLESFKLFVDILEVTINPKILGGIQDYLTAATFDDMATAINNFNRISTDISPSLYTFKDYSLKRIDYCINFSLSELAPGCSYEQVINLIKRSDIPPHFKMWEEYDAVSHRKKSKPGSFYLMNESVNLNVYSKFMKYQDQSRKNMETGKPPIAPEMMDAARDIIRFEVQCKYRKVYALSHRDKETEANLSNQYQNLLTHEYCHDIICNYYKKTIGLGAWYTLRDAISMVKLYHFNRQKENRLIDALQLVNECRSVQNAKLAHSGRDLMAFKRTLADLNNMGINPVTIPREWGIRRIFNLLDAYFCKESEEKVNERIKMEIQNEYPSHGY